MASGALSTGTVTSTSINVNYAFSGVPLSIDSARVYLNGVVVSSGVSSGSGAKTFTGLNPNTSYSYNLTRYSQTLASRTIKTLATPPPGEPPPPEEPVPPPPPPPTTSGTLSGVAVDADTISLNYSYINGTSVSLFRESALVITFGTGNGSGVYTDDGLAPDTIFHYYLRNGATAGSALLASATVGTPELPSTGSLSAAVVDSRTVDLTYTFTDATNASLFNGSTKIITLGSGFGSGVYRVTGLSPDTSYTFYLRNGSSSTDTQLASASAKTIEEARQAAIQQGRILPLNSLITIFNSSLTRVGVLEDYEYCLWTFKYRKVGSFKLEINRYKPNTSYLVKGNILAIYVAGYYRAGIIESISIELNKQGKISENYTICGRSLGGILAERIAMEGTDYIPGYDSQNTYAETAMRHYINVNCMNADDANRDYPLLYLEDPDGERGGNVEYDARFQKIDEILEEICLASGLGWEIVLDVTNKRMVWQVIEGVDRSYGNGVNSTVMFSPKFGNIRLISYTDSSLNSKNVAYVAGQGEAEARDVDTVSYLAATYTGMDRREVFIDARDLDSTDKMLQRGNERLAEMGEETIIEMENLSTGPFSYGEDFYLGDIVTVNYPDIVEADVRVIESQIEITPKELIQNKLILGKSYPDLININDLRFKNVNPEVRR